MSDHIEIESSSQEFNFRDHISEEFRDNLGDIKDLDSLAKGYIHSQKMIGNSVRIPGEDASQEAVTEFYNKLQSIPGVVKIPGEGEDFTAFFNKLGRPESSDKYSFKDTQLQELDNFKEAAFEAGLTNEQADKLLKFYESSVLEPNQFDMEQSREDGEKVLKEKWGADYQARMDGAKLSAAKYSEKYPEAMQDLVNGPAGNNPAFIEILSDIARNMSESEVVKGLAKAQYGMSSEEALDKLQEIKSNSNHAYWDTKNPGHSAAVSKVQQLTRLAYPD